MSSAKPKIVPISTRLFSEDVEEIKRLAEARGIPWQVELRLLVREAVRRGKRKPEIR